MTFIDYWQKLVTRNPPLGDIANTMTITVASFQKQVESAFNAGRAQSESASNPIGSFLDGLLGNRK